MSGIEMMARTGSASNVDREGHIEESIYISRKWGKDQKPMIIRHSVFKTTVIA